MTSIGMGLRSGVIGAAVLGLVVLPGCPSGDDGDDTQGATTTADTGMQDTGMQDTGMESTGDGDAPTHDADMQPIWDAHCNDACHEPGGEWALLDLTDGNAYAALMGMSTQATDLKFIEPGDVDASYLWHKINGTQAAAGGGGVDMPKARTDGSMTMLSQAEFDAIEAWIMAGAPE